MECLLAESQLAGDVGVEWLTVNADPLPEGRFEFLCDLNQTLILHDLVVPDDIETYTCMVDAAQQGFFFLRLFGNHRYQATPTHLCHAVDFQCFLPSRWNVPHPR